MSIFQLKPWVVMESGTRILIVDDEIQSRLLIRKLISDHFPDFIIDEAPTIADATTLCFKFKHLIIFLDIQMRGESGFDLLDSITDVSSNVIFITAHSEYAVKAFRYSAMDYLVKPLDVEEFVEAVKKVLKKMSQQAAKNPEQLNYLRQLQSGNKTPEKLAVPTADGFLFININDILYCRALSNYTEFHLTNKQTFVSGHTLRYYQELLEEQNFFRVHRSYLVNIAFVNRYRKGDGGIIVMNNGEEIEVSRSNKDAFLKALKL